MLNRSAFLFLHGASAAAWAARYDITPCTHPCPDCGEPCTTSIPFATRNARGLAAPPCVCGNEFTPYCVVAVDGTLSLIFGRGRR